MGAPRQPWCLLRGLARGVLLAFGVLWASQAVPCEIAAARYSTPTSAYPHAVLGDALEWARLEAVVRPTGRQVTLSAPERSVFEDLAPRLWDVTGDGLPEIVVVESHQSQGARLAIYAAPKCDQLELLAATPYIGTRFRWLAPVGAADLDGDGAIEIAYVDRPHLAKTLRIWRFDGTQLVETHQLPGVSNHRIGEAFISGGMRICADRPELILADGAWQNVVSVTLTQDGLRPRVLVPFTGKADMDSHLACR